MAYPKIPNYEIIGQVGQGGMAAIYKAVDLRSGYLVAIKALFPQFLTNETVVNNFKQGASYYLYLDHPNIVHLVDFIEDRDASGTKRLFIVMEYIEGTTVADYVAKVTGPMTPERALPIFYQVLDAVGYIHGDHSLYGGALLHLDIKPSNIMLNMQKQVKMIDMGISARLADVRHNTKRCGSPAYMSPEQVRGEGLGRFTDVYALGITLYSMLTGHVPFTGQSHTEIFNKILNNPLPSLASYFPLDDADFCKNPHGEFLMKVQPILAKATAKSPTQRFQTCAEFTQALKQIEPNISYGESTTTVGHVIAGR